MERIRGCLLWWKCLVACLFLEESQHPTCPHSRHKRRWTHVSPIFTHSSQTCVSVDVNLISSRCVQPGIMSSEVSNSPQPNFYSSARARWTRCTEIEPSPTAEATRFTFPERTSPTAKTPGRLVSSICGGRVSGHANPFCLAVV